MNSLLKRRMEVAAGDTIRDCAYAIVSLDEHMVV
jgi:hypothetical protein